MSENLKAKVFYKCKKCNREYVKETEHVFLSYFMEGLIVSNTESYGLIVHINECVYQGYIDGKHVVFNQEIESKSIAHSCGNPSGEGVIIGVAEVIGVRVI